MRESRLSGSVEGVVCKHDSYSDLLSLNHRTVNSNQFTQEASRLRDKESLACQRLSRGAFAPRLSNGQGLLIERTDPTTGNRHTRRAPCFERAELSAIPGAEPRIRPSYRNRISCPVLHCRHGPLGASVLLRLHGPAIWLDPGPGNFRKCFEQTGRGTDLRIHRRMDGGPLRAAPPHDRRNLDGGRSVDWAGKHSDAQSLLFLLHAERAGIRVRWALAESSALVAQVRTVAWQGHGFRVFGNRARRRGRAMDFTYARSTFWLASRAANARFIDLAYCSPRRAPCQRRAQAKGKPHISGA